MKKYVLLIIMLFCCLNTYGNQKDKKYLEIKSTEKIDENKLSKYYLEKREKELKQIFLELDKFCKIIKMKKF